MISRIKLEECIPSHNRFYKTTYSTKDITTQMAMPFLDCQRLDEVLDTSQMILYNDNPDPIKPFTRYIITVTDQEEDGTTNDNYIYRYCESDTVTNVVRGDEPVYKHIVNLIEITKLLERVPVDNLCFTNYLDEKYGYENELEVDIDESKSSGGGIFSYFDISSYDVISENKPRGPYQVVGTTINPKIDIVVTAKTKEQIGFVFYDSYYKVPFVAYKVTTPSGKVINLMNATSFTYDEIGTYTFEQRFFIDEVKWDWLIHYLVKDADITVYWKVRVVEADAKLPTRYTIEEVIDRVLRVYNLRRSGIDSPRFKLDSQLRTYLGSVLSPEFAFTQSTLLDVLTQIGGYIHAIPKLIPSTTVIGSYNEKGEYEGAKVDNYTKWDTISFTFLGQDEKFNNDNYSIYDASHSADDYAKSFVTNVQNATQTNYINNVSIIEPFINGYISPRTESGTFRVSNDEAVIKLSQPIQTILQVLAIDGSGVAHDITGSVKESASYALLKSYTKKDDYTTKSKNFALTYKKGGNTISALAYKTPKEQYGDAYTEKEAIKAIMGIRTSAVQNTIRDMCFQVKYIPIRNFKVRHYKSVCGNEPEDICLYYNQQSNAVDIESYGENIKGALMKTGNAMVAETQYFENYSQAPRMGQVSNDGYYVFAVNKEMSVGVPIKSTAQWSKDFNKMNDFIGVKKTVRQYEISEEESIERNVDYQEFCVVDTQLDIEGKYNMDDEEMVQVIRNRLDVLGFPTTNLLNQVLSKLSNKTPQDGFKPISYVIAKTFSILKAPEQGEIEIVPRDENAPEGYVPFRFYDAYNNIIAVYYADPNGDNYISFDCDFDENDKEIYCGVSGFEGSSFYYGNFSESAILQANFQRSGYKLVGFNVVGAENVVQGMVETELVLIDGEKNFFPIYEYVDETVDNPYQEESHQFLLPVSCFPYGNSVVLSFKATDNFSVGSYVNDLQGTYGEELLIEYSNTVGRFTTMELIFGSNNPIPGGFNSINNIINNGKKLYQFNSTINEKDVLVDYRDNQFIVEKDSRESISLTCQLNFIAGNNKILIGKGLAHSMPMVGDTSTNYRFVIFQSKPKKFNSDIEYGTYSIQDMPSIELIEKYKTICYLPVVALTNGVGYGIIDADNRLCVFVDQPIKAGNETMPIYLQFRGNI